MQALVVTEVRVCSIGWLFAGGPPFACLRLPGLRSARWLWLGVM